MPLTVKVDLELCQGHSVCLSECPAVFDVVEHDDGYPQVVVLQETPDDALRDQVLAAARYCPNHVITVVED
ncbi:MAG: ferredoxin [Gammaproteobacteria bacterium]|nr:ferredoxin [Gammaproteobacteria bacterium]